MPNPYRERILTRDIELEIRSERVEEEMKKLLGEVEKAELEEIETTLKSEAESRYDTDKIIKNRVLDKQERRQQERRVRIRRLKDNILIDQPSYYRGPYDYYRRSEADKIFGEKIEMIKRNPDSEESWKKRESILQEIEERNIIGDILHNNKILGRTGDMSGNKKFHRAGINLGEVKNDEILNIGKVQKEVLKIICLLQSLGGIDSEKSWEWRDLLIGKLRTFSNISFIIELSRDNYYSEARKKQWSEPNEDKQIEVLMKSLIGIDSDRAWKLRNKYFKKYPEWVAVSLQGTTSDRSMEARKRLMDKFPLAVAVSLCGIEANNDILDFKENLMNRNEKDLEVLMTLLEKQFHDE